MSKILIIVFVVYLDACLGAIDSGVTVFGTTVGPNFKRAEGIGRSILIIGTNS